jgi:hypothetical protein
MREDKGKKRFEKETQPMIYAGEASGSQPRTRARRELRGSTQEEPS